MLGIAGVEACKLMLGHVRRQRSHVNFPPVKVGRTSKAKSHLSSRLGLRRGWMSRRKSPHPKTQQLHPRLCCRYHHGRWLQNRPSNQDAFAISEKATKNSWKSWSVERKCQLDPESKGFVLKTLKIGGWPKQDDTPKLLQARRRALLRVQQPSSVFLRAIQMEEILASGLQTTSAYLSSHKRHQQEQHEAFQTGRKGKNGVSACGVSRWSSKIWILQLQSRFERTPPCKQLRLLSGRRDT